MAERETIRPLLERDLIEWAEDESLRLVWADLLQIDGDPLGRLVVLDHTAAQGPPHQRERVAAEAARLREALDARLWTREAASARRNPGVRLSWKLGFVSELDVHVAKLDNRHTPAAYQRRRSGRLATLAWIVPTLLMQPALRFVEVIRVDIPDVQAEGARQWTERGGLGASTLREIHIGHPPTARSRPSGAWESGSSGGGRGSASETLLGSFRRLRQLTVGGEMVRIPARSGGGQARQHHVESLRRRPLTSPNRAALARALWDSSSLVHQAAFASALSLGPRADFLLGELAWLFVPPLSKKDPRQVLALGVLAAIGPASTALLPTVLTHHEALLTNHARHEALMEWFIALGPLAKAGLPLVDTLLAQPPASVPKSLQTKARRARKALT